MENKKITLATVKSFIRKNKENLFIDVRSKFDGMVDGCRQLDYGFEKAEPTEWNTKYTLGVSGTWFVGRSNDYFTYYEDDTFKGVKVSNSCGHFILAIRKY